MDLKHISSVTNPAVREAVRLRRKKRRYERRLFLTEGEDLLEAALTAGHIPRQVFVHEGSAGAIGALIESYLAPKPDAAFEPEVFSCNGAVMDKLTGLGSSSRVIAILGFIDLPLDGLTTGSAGGGSVPETSRGPLVYLSRVHDPGNAGTMIRSAAALGTSGVVFSPDAADPYSDKAQRAAMGAVFQTPLSIDVGSEAIVAWARTRVIPLICADPAKGEAPWVIEGAGRESVLTRPFVLVLGSEREGLPAELARAADMRLRIPQSQAAESLNVAMAGTIILYEAMRQRNIAGEQVS